MQYLTEAENNITDVKKTLRKLPKKHRSLVKGYKFVFEPNNTLKDGKHIGYIDEEKKKILVCAPWNYGREYAVLHEIAHAVWKYFVDDKSRKEWQKIVKSTKDKQNQGAEELFCMAYASRYAKNKIVIHDHKEWERFIIKISS